MAPVAGIAAVVVVVRQHHRVDVDDGCETIAEDQSTGSCD
jgi:hypothetical protein